MSDPSSAPAPPSHQDGIEHVVLLIMENHSFDQMLGALQQRFPDLDGVTPQLASQRFNLTSRG